MANALVNVDFINNSRGGLSLVHNGCRFVVKSRREERTYWVCAVRGCPARATTADRILLNQNGEHNHAADPFQVECNKIMKNIRKRCRQETKPVPAIYKEELASLRTQEWDETGAAVVQRLPTYEGCKSNLYRERSKGRPKLPKTRQEIALEGEWTQTSTGQQFLQIDDGEENRILVFATRKNLEDLCSVTTIYGDGTFYSCPDLFYQLYSWHCFIDGHMFPVMFAFLPGKSREVYRRLFEEMKTKCGNLGLDLSPDTIFMGHEVASRIAAKDVFPTTEVKACFFHYTQCIWRKVQATGPTAAYRENEDIHRLVRRAAVLPLVPEVAVEDVWFNDLTDIADLDLPGAVQTFTDYVTEQWVGGEKQTWNHFCTQGPRTTNHLEGWHNMLKKAAEHPHPNIFSIIRTLQHVESLTCIRLIQYAAGGTRPTKRRKYVAIDERLASLKGRLRDGTLTTIQYADAASYMLRLYMCK